MHTTVVTSTLETLVLLAHVHAVMQYIYRVGQKTDCFLEVSNSRIC